MNIAVCTTFFTVEVNAYISAFCQKLFVCIYPRNI